MTTNMSTTERQARTYINQGPSYPGPTYQGPINHAFDTWGPGIRNWYPLKRVPTNQRPTNQAPSNRVPTNQGLRLKRMVKRQSPVQEDRKCVAPNASQKTVEDLPEVNLQLENCTANLQSTMGAETGQQEQIRAVSNSDQEVLKQREDLKLHAEIQELKEKLAAADSLSKESEATARDLKNELAEHKAAWTTAQESQKQLEDQRQEEKSTLLETILLNQREEDKLHAEIQEWKEELAAEESLRKEVEATAQELKDALSQHNAAWTTAKESQQQLRRQWQEETSSLQETIILLQATMEEKEKKFLKTQNLVDAQVDALQSQIEEKLAEKAKKKRCWLARLFCCFTCK